METVSGRCLLSVSILVRRPTLSAHLLPHSLRHISRYIAGSNFCLASTFSIRTLQHGHRWRVQATSFVTAFASPRFRRPSSYATNRLAIVINRVQRRQLVFEGHLVADCQTASDNVVRCSCRSRAISSRALPPGRLVLCSTQRPRHSSFDAAQRSCPGRSSARCLTFDRRSRSRFAQVAFERIFGCCGHVQACEVTIAIISHCS